MPYEQQSRRGMILGTILLINEFMLKGVLLNINQRSFEGIALHQSIQLKMKSFAEFVLLQTIFEGLVQLSPVKFVNLQEKALHPLIIHFLKRQLSENGQKLDLGDSIESIDEVFPGKVINGVHLSQILGPFFNQFFIQEIQTCVGVKLDIEIIGGCLVIFEKQRLVILVYYEEIIQTYLLLCLHYHYNYYQIKRPLVQSQFECLCILFAVNQHFMVFKSQQRAGTEKHEQQQTIAIQIGKVF